MADLDPIAGPDGGDEGRRLAKFWLEQVAKVDAEQKSWLKRGRSIERRYRDQRNLSEEKGQRRMNNLWANVQIMYPALYGKCPVPIAERRFKDKDPIGRAAAQILERALRNDLEFDDYHESIGSAVLDYLLPGRGVVWVRYEPELERGISIPVDGQNDLRDEEGDIEAEPDSEEHDKLEDTGDRIVRESTPVDFISWEDAYFFPAKARTWGQVRAGGKRLYMSYDEIVDWLVGVFKLSKERAEEIADQIPLQKDDREKRDTAEGRATTDKRDDKAQVFEIWDKDQEEIVWVADGCDWIINRVDDPLKLEHFFPFPRPLAANATNTTIVPVPDYIQYQDQARGIDELTQRISQLAKATKIAGLYDASVDEVVRLLDESVENELLPVDNWRAFADKLGPNSGGPIWLLPLEQIVTALKELVEIRKLSIEDMDRLTGITDVLRGVTTDARETLGKGRLNNNNGKSRLRQRQDEVARFARDVIRIKAEIMSKHFRNRSLVDASGAFYEEGLGIADVMHYAGEGVDEEAGATGSSPSVPAGAGSMPPAGSPAPPMAGNVVPMRPGMRTPAPAGEPGFAPGGSGMMPGASPQMTEFGPIQEEAVVQKALEKIKAAIKLLRNDYNRGFRIDIEVDSTIVGDEEADKQSRSEFIGMVTTYIKEAGQLAVENPQITPLLGKMLQFGVRGFRVGRDLEAAIEEFCDQAEEHAKAAASQPKKPTPEEMKAQAEIQTEKIHQQGEQQNQRLKGQMDQQKLASEARLKELELQIKQREADMELRVKALEMQLKEREMHMQTQHATIAHHQRLVEMTTPKAAEPEPKKDEAAA